MCCSPEHIGAPPEWHREMSGEVISEAPRSVSPAAVPREVMSAWAALIGPAGPAAARPESTEGGQGRALLSTWTPDGRARGRYEDLAGALNRYGEPEAIPDFR